MGFTKDGTEFVPYYPNGNAVVVKAGEKAEFTFENQFTEWPNGFYREVTPTPEATITPVVTEEPEVTITPEITEIPEETNTPEATKTPENTNPPQNPTTQNPSGPSDHGNAGNSAPVKTGDNTPISFFVLLIAMTTVIMAYSGRKLRRRQK